MDGIAEQINSIIEAMKTLSHSHAPSRTRILPSYQGSVVRKEHKDAIMVKKGQVSCVAGYDLL